jgi:molecular chaperone DnaJ
MAKADYYEILGLGRDATEEQVKKAYRKLAFQHHPDRNPGDKAAELKFKEATEAYEVLRDPEKRRRYDQFGHAGVGGAAGGPAVDFSGFDLADALRAFMRDFGGDFGGFEEIFGRSGRPGPREQRGDDLQVRVKLTLEEIAEGVEKKIRLKHLKRCATCHGSGSRSGKLVNCPTCKGRGQVRHVQSSFFGQFVNVAVCPDCGGDGRRVEDACPECRGEGTIRDTDTVSVRVPPGVMEGNYIPLRGLGDAGRRGGPPGDLIVIIEEKPHAVFERHGADLHCEVPVGFPVLALGGKIDVPTLTGEAALHVPAGTASGQVFRLRGNGLPRLRSSGSGDLLASLRVWVPAKLGAKERQLLEELGRSEAMKPPPPGKSVFERVRDAFGG